MIKPIALSRWLRRVLPVLLTGLAILFLAPHVSAQTAMTCSPSGGAPIMGGSSTMTAYYSHRCNYIPSGVSSMGQHIDIQIQGDCIGTNGSDGTLVQANRFYRQTGVDFTVSDSRGSSECYQPYMFYSIDGSFSYGSLPGCGRQTSTSVSCQYHGAIYYAY